MAKVIYMVYTELLGYCAWSNPLTTTHCNTI